MAIGRSDADPLKGLYAGIAKSTRGMWLPASAARDQASREQVSTAGRLADDALAATRLTLSSGSAENHIEARKAHDALAKHLSSMPATPDRERHIRTAQGFMAAHQKQATSGGSPNRFKDVNAVAIEATHNRDFRHPNVRLQAQSAAAPFQAKSSHELMALHHDRLAEKVGRDSPEGQEHLKQASMYRQAQIGPRGGKYIVLKSGQKFYISKSGAGTASIKHIP